MRCDGDRFRLRFAGAAWHTVASGTVVSVQCAACATSGRGRGERSWLDLALEFGAHARVVGSRGSILSTSSGIPLGPPSNSPPRVASTARCECSAHMSSINGGRGLRGLQRPAVPSYGTARPGGLANRRAGRRGTSAWSPAGPWGRSLRARMDGRAASWTLRDLAGLDGCADLEGCRRPTGDGCADSVGCTRHAGGCEVVL